ncbi:MAG TPA: four helix bundle protein [Lacibacter sp.]|nr:four helix bundle protein [Lacibacter sp.]HMO87650.1 four helix bundle protein [Lacibacter sp.]
MAKEKHKFDLEDRLVDFACMCLDVCDKLPGTKSGQNLEYQLSKSSTAPALIYGEAQAAESRADFIHKMKMCLKEIKESRINLKIIRRKPVVVHENVERAFNESNELMAIFLTSIETAERNDERRKRQ